jgi:Domain of unknown function (DUF1996)
MQKIFSLLWVGLLMTLSGFVSASFLIGCKPLISSVRVDPILSFGGISSHNHTFWGASSISAFTDTSTGLRASRCFTCSGGDKSAYWAPTLYWKRANGLFVTVPINDIAVYWDNTIVGTGQNVNISMIPLDLRQVEGNASAKSRADAAFRYSWQCGGRYYAEYPPVNCNLSWWRLGLVMRDCWDGVNLFLPGNKHMAHSNQLGGCPLTHPIRIWTLRIEITYGILPEMIWNATAPPPLFLGGPDGDSAYGVHIDFINGLAPAEQKAQLDRCPKCTGDGNVLRTPPTDPSCTSQHMLQYIAHLVAQVEPVVRVLSGCLLCSLCPSLASLQSKVSHLP